MLNVIIFNFSRFLRSKTLMFVTCLFLLFNLAFYFVWVNVAVEMYIHWITIGSLLVYFSFANIYGISNIMVGDVQNGVLSLEIRKGVNYHMIMWVKFLVYKSILWFFLLTIMLIFFIIVITSSSGKKNELLYLHVPGLTAIFAFDILFSGICLFFGAFLSSKLLAGVTSFLVIPFVMSPSLATKHLKKTEEFVITNKVGWYEFLNIQAAATKNPKGLINYLYSEFQFYNQNNVLRLTKKDVSTGEHNGLYASFDELQEFINDDGQMISKIFASWGQPFLVADYLNSVPYYNTAGTFELTTNYQNSNIYNFLQDAKVDLSDEATKTTNLDLGATDHNNKGDYAKGIEALENYFNYLQTNEVKNNLIKKYKFTNFEQDLNVLKNSLLSMINNKHYKIVDKSGRSLWSLVYFNDDEPLFVNEEGVNDIANSQLFQNEWKENASELDTWLADGNQVFNRMLFNIIPYTAMFAPNTLSDRTKNSVYDLMYYNHKERRHIFATNPMLTFPYMTLFTNYAKNPLINENVAHLFGGLGVQDLLLTGNNDYDTANQDAFKDVEDLPIKSFQVTSLIFPVWIYYLWYFSIGLCLGLAAHFIYNKKIRP